jgi:hypothetical protein
MLMTLKTRTVDVSFDTVEALWFPRKINGFSSVPHSKVQEDQIDGWNILPVSMIVSGRQWWNACSNAIIDTLTVSSGLSRVPGSGRRIAEKDA